MKFNTVIIFIGLFFVVTGFPIYAQPTNLTEDQRFNITLEALSRLRGAETNPAVQAVIEKTLTRTRGTPRFVQLVKQLQLKNQVNP